MRYLKKIGQKLLLVSVSVFVLTLSACADKRQTTKVPPEVWGKKGDAVLWKIAEERIMQKTNWIVRPQ